MKKDQPKPVATLRERQKAETYALILDTAKSLFNEVGFEKATIRIIAQKAGIGLGTISKHFAGKSDLLAAALYEDIENTMQEAKDTLPENKSVGEQFLHMAEKMYQYYARRPSLSKTYLQNLFFMEGDWFNRLNDQMDRDVQFFAALVDEAKARGEIVKTTDSMLLTTGFFANYFFVLFVSFKGELFDPAASHGFLKMLVNQMMTGVLAGK